MTKKQCAYITYQDIHHILHYNSYGEGELQLKATMVGNHTAHGVFVGFSFSVAVLVYLLMASTPFLKRSKEQNIVCPVTSEDRRTSRNEAKIFKVPNIVYYLFYADEATQLKFKHWISVLSAHKILKPDKIIIFFDNEPKGEYWYKIKQISSVQVLKDDRPSSVLGEKIQPSNIFTAASNLGRIMVLLKTGGIYLDFDVLVIRSFDNLRRYPCTVGYETDNSICGSIIICSKESPFLYLWANAYLDDYRPDHWAYNSGRKPTQLAKRFPWLVHTENKTLQRPNWMPGDIEKIWGNDSWDWRQNYAIHTWYRFREDVLRIFFPNATEPDEDNIIDTNNTYSEIARYIMRLP